MRGESSVRSGEVMTDRKSAVIAEHHRWCARHPRQARAELLWMHSGGDKQARPKNRPAILGSDYRYDLVKALLRVFFPRELIQKGIKLSDEDKGVLYGPVATSIPKVAPVVSEEELPPTVPERLGRMPSILARAVLPRDVPSNRTDNRQDCCRRIGTPRSLEAFQTA